MVAQRNLWTAALLAPPGPQAMQEAWALRRPQARNALPDSYGVHWCVSRLGRHPFYSGRLEGLSESGMGLAGHLGGALHAHVLGDAQASGRKECRET
jgi:hypothetical protein